MAVPPLPWTNVADVVSFQGAQAQTEEQAAETYLREARSETQGTTYLLQQHVFNANLFESHATNSWQEANVAVESVRQLAELRHQGVFKGLASMAEENHRGEMAQVEVEASRKLHEQGVMHASAHEACHVRQHTTTMKSRAT